MSIANVVALKKIVAAHRTAPLDEVVQAVNITLELAVTADNKAGSHRLDAGRMLVDLRRRVEDDGDDWWKWQKGKFVRTRKDIEKLMRLAKSDEPEAAVEKERTETRERVRAHRTAERTVRSSPEPPVQAPPADSLVESALHLVRQMTDHQRHDFMAKLKEEYP